MIEVSLRKTVRWSSRSATQDCHIIFLEASVAFCAQRGENGHLPCSRDEEV